MCPRVASSDRTAANDEIVDQDNQGDDQQEVNEGASDIGQQANEPHDKDNDQNSPENGNDEKVSSASIGALNPPT